MVVAMVEATAANQAGEDLVADMATMVAIGDQIMEVIMVVEQ